MDRSRIVRSIAVAAVALLVTTVVGVVGASPAMAAGGPAVVSTSVQIVDSATQQPLSTLQTSIADPSTLQFGLNISYSCGQQAACTGVTIHVDPQQLDTFYNDHRFASYVSATLPSGATLTGNSAAAGQTFLLGDLAPGTAGSFVALYADGYTGFNIAPQSFFLDGTTITESVTIDAANSVAAVSDAATATWKITTPDPAVSMDTPPTARVDTDYTYTVYMTTGCLDPHSNGNRGYPDRLCASGYTAVDTLPAGAEFVSASDGGTYQSGVVTWTDSGENAAPGWKSLNVFGPPRTVTVRFPASMVTDPDDCAITVTNSFAVEATYLDGAVKSASTQQSHQLNACPAFASAQLVSKTSTQQATGTVWQGVGNYWRVTVTNKSNVPGVATVTDDDLDQGSLPVTTISLSSSGTIDATLDDGTPVSQVGTTYTAPAGRYIVAATVVSDPLVGPNVVESSQPNQTVFQVAYDYVPTAVPAGGVTRTNTASATMSFPTEPSLSALDLGDKSATITAVVAARLVPTISSVAVAGGGNPVPGTPVTFTVGGTMSDMDPSVALQPEYVFVAPYQWDIVPGSASIPGLADAILEYRTVTIAGQQREEVFATRPAGTVWGVNETWPSMTVVATPSAEAAAGSSATATMYVGDAADHYTASNAIWNATSGNYLYVDAADLDGDGATTDSFAWVDSAAITVGAASLLSVLKEVCHPDPTATDGCDWVSDPSSPATVDVGTTTVRYRVTITNSGNTPLSGVVGYDVLPYPNDVGTSQASGGTPRGSTFAETAASVSGVSAGVTLQYSTSVDPCRPQVYPGGPAGCVDQWTSAVAGASAIRATVNGALAPAQSVSFDYLATVVGSPAANAIACNSVAVGSASTPVAEPSPVCAQVQANAGLSIVKSAQLADLNGNGQVDAGESIGYSFVVTNTGNEALHDVTVDDPKVTGIAPAPVTLAPGAQQVFTADPFVAGQADIDAGGTVSNTATATGLGQSNQPVVSAPSTIVTPLASPAPALSLAKSATLDDDNGNALADAGETISYSFVVTNTGNVTLSGVTVDDPKVAGIAPAPVTLLPGERVTFTADDYRVTDADLVRGSVANTATATATDPAGGAVVSDPSTATTPTAPIPDPPAPGPGLAFTGVDVVAPAGMAALLLLAGIAMIASRRRRIGNS